MTRWPVNIPLVASLVAIAFASIVMAAQFVELASAVLTPSPRPDPTRARLDDYIAEHGDAMNTYRGRFDGRSLWFKPKAPPKAPRVNIVKRDEPSEPPPPPPPPSKPRTYPGPSVSFVVGDDVWFHDGVHASVGGEEVNGVTVVAADPPWTVTLEYGGWEYDIKIFERKSIFPDRPKKTSNGSFPGIKPVEGSEAGLAGRQQ